ncbi:MAG: DedA family protein [Chloroflexi bacterium]|nr:DedA family protein [Chloroflexota bacterium]
MGLKEVLDAITLWAQSIISTAGYPGLALVMFLENVFPPIPSEVVLPLAGSLVLDGRFTLFGVTLVGALGSIAGALVFYAIGHLLGEDRTRELICTFGKWLMLSETDFDKALDWFNRYGEGVIFFGRMVPIVRSLVSIPAGIATMNLVRFCAYTAVGTGLWSFLLAFAGYLLGQSWPLVSEWIGRYEKIILVLVIAAIIAFVVSRLLQRRRVKAMQMALSERQKGR